MPAPAVIESFCERCGTRYTFEPPRQRGRSLTSIGKTLGILSENGTPESASLTASRDPFHGMFHFCLECRQYTCPDCWNAEAGFCQGCYPLPESPDMLAAESAASNEATTHLLVALEQVRVASTPNAWPGTDLRQPGPEPEPLAAPDAADSAAAVLASDPTVAALPDGQEKPLVAARVLRADEAPETPVVAALASADVGSPEAPETSFEWIDPEPVAELTAADIARVGEAPTFTAMVAAAVAASRRAPQPAPAPSAVAEAAVEVPMVDDEPKALVEVAAAAEVATAVEVPAVGVAAAVEVATAVEPQALDAEALEAVDIEATADAAPVAVDAEAVLAETAVVEPVADEAVAAEPVLAEAAITETASAEVETVVVQPAMPVEPEVAVTPRRHEVVSDPEADAWLAMDATVVAAAGAATDAAPAPWAASAETVTPEVDMVAEAAEPTPELAAEPVVELAAEPTPELAAEPAAQLPAVAHAEPALEPGAPTAELAAEPAVAEPAADIAAVAQAEPDLPAVAEETSATPVAAPPVVVLDAEPDAYTNGHDHAAPVAGLAALGIAHTASSDHDQPDLDEAWAGLLAAVPATELEAQPEDLPADDWQALAPSLGPDVVQPVVVPPTPAAPAPTAATAPAPLPASAPAVPETAPVAWPAPIAWQHTAPDAAAQPPAWRPYGTVYATPSAGSPSANGALHPAMLSGMPGAAAGVVGFSAATPSNGHLPTGVRPCHHCALPVSAQARFCRRCGQPQV